MCAADLGSERRTAGSRLIEKTVKSNGRVEVRLKVREVTVASTDSVGVGGRGAADGVPGVIVGRAGAMRWRLQLWGATENEYQPLLWL